MTVCHMTWILFLEPFTECAQSLRIRADTSLDQDCILKATVCVCASCTVCLKATVRECTTCMDVSWFTTRMNFNTPPPAQIAHF